MTFEGFITSVDAVVRARTDRDYGMYAGPHVAYWQRGSISARLREGTAQDVELDVARDGERPLYVACDPRGAQRVAETILAAWDETAPTR